MMVARPLKVAWISFFPVEWLPELPAPLQGVPRWHPATWQRVLVEEFRACPELRLEIFAVRRHFPKTFQFERGNARFHCVRLPRGMRTLSLFWWETLLLRRLLRAVQPDLVHAWGTERGAALVASRLGYPYLVSMQGLLEWCVAEAESDWFGRLEARLEPTSLRRASVVTAESRFAIEWLRHRYPHLDLHQVEHAPNWLFHRLERRPQLRPARFLFVGSMCQLKGTDLLLQALDRLRPELDFHLRIIGGGAPDFLNRLRAETSPALWERITLRHGLTQAEVAEEMAQATMVLFPTRVDNSPNSIKEAVAAGVPVVASAVGGIRDYVASGGNGFTFPAGNLEELVTAIRAAVAHPLFSRGQVEPETLRSMREYLSPQTMARKFLRVYGRVLKVPNAINKFNFNI